MKNTIALIYDFDKTLCDRDMQEYSFIPNLGIDAKDFWNEADNIRKENKMDQVLTYMYLMFKKSKDKNIKLTRSYLNKMGENIKFFPGVVEWFDRINEYGKERGYIIEHYIISSGLKEIIEGSEIYKYFHQIYASEFYYDESNNACWPKITINYTNKTQYLIRINKGVLDISDDYKINRKMLNEDRRIPATNMIYIGDGLTDIPCMKLTKDRGGISICVYNREKKQVVDDILEDERVNYVALANYTEGSEIDNIVKNRIDMIAKNH